MSSNSELSKRRQDAIPAGLGTMHPIFCERAENAELWDVEGKRYIDFAAGIAVLNTGHLHPKVKAAVSAELEKMSHVCFQVTPYERYVQVAERLNALVPGDTPKKTLLLSSGAEAVENAVKIARAYTGRSGVIAFSGGFHGRTLFALALTGKVVPYKAGFGPLSPEVFHAPYPIEYLGISVDAALSALDRLFTSDVDPARVAAMIVEPVLGEGGFYAAPPEFLQALRRVCDQHGIVLIVDEIQTGFGRTGRMFASEYAGIEADLMTTAKSLAGGFPLSAVTGKAEVMEGPNPGGLGGTYAGSPLGCVAGLAMIEVIEEEKLADAALHVSEVFDARLKALQAKFPAKIGHLRTAHGAMMAMELVSDGDANKPDAELTKALVGKAYENGLALLSCGARGNVIRFLPALNISDKLINEGMDILDSCLQQLV